MSVLEDQWAAVVWVFDHPIGKAALLILTWWLIWSAVTKTVKVEGEKQEKGQEAFSALLDAKLSKYDEKFSALFSHLAGDSRRRDFTDALDRIIRHEQSVQNTVGTWDADKAESDPDYGSMASSGGQFSALFDGLGFILTNFQDDLEIDLLPHLDSVCADDVKNAATPNLEKITKVEYAERYKTHMQKIALVKRILRQNIKKLDERINSDNRILFPKDHL